MSKTNFTNRNHDNFIIERNLLRSLVRDVYVVFPSNMFDLKPGSIGN